MAQTAGFVAGHDACQGLSDLGRRQAEALGARVAGSGELGTIGGIYASLMARSIETAEILATALDRGPVVRDCGFCEHHPGEMDGLSWDEADRVYPPGPWSEDGRRTPSSETWAEMAQRVTRALDSLIDRHPGQSALVVSHGGVIVHSMVRWLGLAPTPAVGRRARIEPFNTSITEWVITPAETPEDGTVVRLARFNDHAHLMGADLLT